MKSKFQMKVLVSSLALVFSGAACAVELPTNLKNDINSINTQQGTSGTQLTIGTDGSVTMGTTQFAPVLPTNYDATKATTSLKDLIQQADGSFVDPKNNLQFVPIAPPAPGELPQLPSNFTPLPGNSLPSDFKPPAGMVTSPKLPLPTGVTVPSKTPADMISDLEKAGVLPKGMVTINTDGTVDTSTGASYIPFVPSTSQQGKLKTGNQPKMTVDSTTGVITFPDGTQYAPVVAGSTPGSVTLPTGFTPSSDVTMPKEVTLPPMFAIPPKMPLPQGVTLPAGVTIPDNYSYMIPPGTTLPPGVKIPSTVQTSPDVAVPPGITLPAGTKIDTTNLPKGTQVLPNGMVVVPGTSIPSGVTPPSNWTPPSGVTKQSDGSYYVPPPPQNGYDQPLAPTKVNPDGTTVNKDGTTNPAPTFIGKIGTDGTVQANTGAGVKLNTPANFQPQSQQFQTGQKVGGAFDPSKLDSTTGKVTFTVPTGMTPPSGATCTGGSCTMTPPGFVAPTKDASGNMTIKLPPGATPPPGATVNKDGTVTFAPPPPPSGCTMPTGGTMPPGGTMPGGTQPTGTMPTGTQPTGTQPTGTQPTGTQPTGPAPTGPAPTGPAPAPKSGSFAADPMPTGPAPTGPAPTGPAPTGTQPTGTQPTGTMPTGTMPTGTMPTGTMPTGTQPTGTMPTGTQPTAPKGVCG